jgi:SAM-dependent methyltransferase
MGFLQKLKDIFRYTLEPTAIEFRSTRKVLLKSLHAVNPGIIFDCGCGDKPYKSLFAGKYSKYFGMDFPGSSNKKMLDFYGSGLYCPIKNDSFNTVLLIQVLEHTPDPERLLSEVFRVLKNDGIIIATIPFVYSLHCEPYDFFRFTNHGIKALFEKKFEIISLTNKTYFFSTFAQMLILHLWMPVKNIKNKLLYVLIGLPVLVLISIIQLLGILLEPLSKDQKFTTGYCVIARKRSGLSEAKQ